jgi:hypothetical protein
MRVLNRFVLPGILLAGLAVGCNSKPSSSAPASTTPSGQPTKMPSAPQVPPPPK